MNRRLAIAVATALGANEDVLLLDTGDLAVWCRTQASVSHEHFFQAIGAAYNLGRSDGELGGRTE